jgi:excisionase family DNA binding protein
MTTREVAEYLRIKERKVYELVREGRIPCSRVTGKWLFPRPLVDLWLARATELPDGLPPEAVAGQAPPAVVAGSHDPLLDWALRQSGSDLALLPGGSLDGLARLAAGEAMVAGLHVLDDESGEYNLPVIAQALAGRPVVAIEWARRRQGLVVAPDNPLGIASIADLAARKARVVPRQQEAGSQILFLHLLGRAELTPEDLNLIAEPARSETDLALAVLEGRADAGLAIEAAARQHRLGFVPLHEERYDLVMARRDYFEPPVQQLMEFVRTRPFADRAHEMRGYDVSGVGRVVMNA